MGKAGVAQLHIGAGPGDAVYLHRKVQGDCGGIVEPDTVETAVDPFSGHDAGGGLHGLPCSGQAGLTAVAADAAGTVSAHFADAAVAVVKEHLVIAALSGSFHHHQPIGSNGQAPLTQNPGDLGKCLLRQMLFQIVQYDEVVSGAIHFPKAQSHPSCIT